MLFVVEVSRVGKTFTDRIVVSASNALEVVGEINKDWYPAKVWDRITISKCHGRVGIKEYDDD